MAEAQCQILRGYELRLLRCTLSPPPSDSPSPFPFFDINNNLHAHINDLLTCIEAGNYLQALSSPGAKLLVELSDLTLHSADLFYSDLVEQFLEKGTTSIDEEERACRVILVMCVAVAAFFCFIQCNITGSALFSFFLFFFLMNFFSFLFHLIHSASFCFYHYQFFYALSCKPTQL